MLKFRKWKILAALFLGLSHAPSFPEDVAKNEIKIDARRNGSLVVIDASVFVQATPREVWDVLTDYEHMTEYFPDLTSSKIIGKTENGVTVEQKGKVSFGPFFISFGVVRDIELQPYTEIKSRVISGSVKKGLVLTTLVPEESGVRMIYHSEAEPNIWVPPGIGLKFIEIQTRAHFEKSIKEISRRKALKGGL